MPAGSETEDWLRSERIPFTSFPAHLIIGPGNYNRWRSWFFESDRARFDRGRFCQRRWQHDTQLGHVSDLAYRPWPRCLEVESGHQPDLTTFARPAKGIQFFAAWWRAGPRLAASDRRRWRSRPSFQPASTPRPRKAFPCA